MSTDSKKDNVPAGEQNSAQTQPVTVSMKKLVAGVSTVFAGVIQMLEALEPEMAKQLVSHVVQENSEGDVDSVASEASCTEQAAADTAVASEKEKPDVEEAAPDEDTPASTPEKAQSVTVDDLTRIIVRKVKQDRSNNEKIGSILKTYGVARVSELPAEKYEAFLTDISQL